MTDVLRFKKLSPNAHTPSTGSDFAAGVDLKSAYKYTIPRHGSCLVKTDLQIMVPDGTYGRIAPRSGLALNHGISVGGGVIDPDYRGNVCIILFNHGQNEFKIEPGDRVGQIICEKVSFPKLVEVEEMNATKRGSDGFGSTGKK